MDRRKKWLALGAVLALLAAAFWYGGGAPGLQGWGPSSPAVSAPSFQEPDAPDRSPASSAQAEAPDRSDPPQEPVSQPAQSSSAPPFQTPEAPHPPEETPDPAQPPREAPALPEGSAPEGTGGGEEEAPVCTLSIRCDAVLDHLDWLDPALAELIPADGMILAPTQAPLEEGETAFDLLQRLTRQEGIHLEASFTPGYDSSYVEGIANLYEFDCGQQSGWLYRINGVSPGYGSSQYVLSPGDTVEWIYTCDMGADAGVTP